jgi:hypothetical protein
MQPQILMFFYCVVQLFQRSLLQSAWDSDIILAMQSVRNSHLQMMLPSVRAVLFNNTAPTIVRMAAAQAMETFKNNKDEVRLFFFLISTSWSNCYC